MHGFKHILIEYLKRIQPARILEWGPGLSTEVMLEHAPRAQIVSVEHDEIWHARADEQFGSRITLLHERCTNRNSNYAHVAYDHAPFDFVFVDGRRRVECVLTALKCLSEPSKIVMLHDACRDRYMRTLSHYAKLVEVRSNTAIFTTKDLTPR